MFLLCVKNNFYGDEGICLIKKKEVLYFVWREEVLCCNFIF